MASIAYQVTQLLKHPTAVKAFAESRQVQEESIELAIKSAPRRKNLIDKLVAKPAGLRSIMANETVQEAARVQVISELRRLMRAHSLEEIQAMASDGSLFKLLPEVNGDGPVQTLNFSDLLADAGKLSELSSMLSSFDPARHGGEFPPVELSLNSGKKKGSRKTRKP